MRKGLFYYLFIIFFIFKITNKYSNLGVIISKGN